MATMTPTTITIPDRNETKFLIAHGFSEKASPRDANTLDFTFEATEVLFDARRAYSLNHPVPILSFIAASRTVDKLIFEHRHKGGHQ